MPAPQPIFIIVGGIGLCVTLFGVVLFAYTLGRFTGFWRARRLFEYLPPKGSSDEL